MKPPVQRLESVPTIDGGFVVSVPIPARMKAYFEAAHWRAYLDGQIECNYGCAVFAFRTGDHDLATRCARSRWEIDKQALRKFRWRSLEPIQLRFRLDPAIEWERVGTAIGIPAVKLLQAALATRYCQALENAALERVARFHGIAAGSIIPIPAACPG